MECNQRVAIIGQSYVRRLPDFMGQPRYTNLRLQQATVDCLAVGGARVSDRSPKSLRRKVDLRRCVNADVAILHIGENDHQRMSAEAAAAEIQALAVELLEQYYVSIVVIM